MLRAGLVAIAAEPDHNGPTIDHLSIHEVAHNLGLQSQSKQQAETTLCCMGPDRLSCRDDVIANKKACGLNGENLGGCKQREEPPTDTSTCRQVAPCRDGLVKMQS
jgi:hypothetical protein